MEPVRCGTDVAFSRGLVSAPGIFYNGHGGPAGISASDSRFHFLSAYVTPYQDSPFTLIGFRDGVEVERFVSRTLKHNPASPVRLNFGTRFYNVDNVEIAGNNTNNFVRTSTAPCMIAAAALSLIEV